LTRDLPLARSHHHATHAVYPPASPHGVFWRSFTKLPAQQQHRAREAFFIFKQNPFDSRLGAHKIQKLSGRYGRVVYAAEIEANLRVVFYMDSNTVVTIDIGSHDLYR
jgi:hypothetical protein